MASDWKDRVTAPFASQKQFNYSALPGNFDDDAEAQPRPTTAWTDRRKVAIRFTTAAIILAVAGFFVVSFTRTSQERSCDNVYSGFYCKTKISHYWGQYAPYYSVPSDISADIPEGCDITFAQILSRHGARAPTLGKTLAYAELIDRIQASVEKYGKPYRFIRDYEYELGANDLTAFGEKQLINSGVKFYKRYEKLARNVSPFVRSADQKRVVDSALRWTQGFHQARLADKNADFPDAYPYELVLLPEADGFNNTLSPSTCPAFREGPDTGHDAQEIWANIFVPPITDRVSENLPGVNLSDSDIIHLMDMCPFDTVANKNGRLSPFCNLFSSDEWESFDYYQSLGKWYGYANGSPLGPTQGVGFANELIARLTGQPVSDTTCTNRTMDKSRESFPLDSMLYADFSHDNDMLGMFSALGLYNATEHLSNTTRASPMESEGFAASWVVPFAARMFVEKMQCRGTKEELVRVLINDRVIPLQNCNVDELGRCTLSKFVNSLSFARQGGHWDMCFE
ncbi:histidine phosphatase superfamily [Xylaria nigripes]|nr:histidine phosphatase superfamily [Xylaria nigripes]